jgi:hypothetical protein
MKRHPVLVTLVGGGKILRSAGSELQHFRNLRMPPVRFSKPIGPTFPFRRTD